MPRNTKPNRGARDNIYKRGDRWYVRFWHEGLEIRRSAGTSKDTAQILLARLRQEAERGSLGLAKKNTVTLKDWAGDYLKWAEAHKKSYARDVWCMQQLVDEFGDLRLQDISRTKVEAFMRQRRQEVAPSTVNRQVALLRKALSLAVEHKKIDVNPVRGVKLFREEADRVPVLEADDEKKLMDNLSEWMQWVVRLALTTGCRAGELLALRWRHVDLSAGHFVVETSKSGESRRIPIHPAILEELRRRRGTPEGYVVIRANGTVPDGQSVSKCFKYAARKADRGDLRFHDLRHVAASRFLATGANLPEVADLLGHKTLVMAKRYAHTNPTRMKDLVARMVVVGDLGGSTDR